MGSFRTKRLSISACECSVTPALTAAFGTTTAPAGALKARYRTGRTENEMAKINRILWITAAALVSASALAPAWAGCGDVAPKKHIAFLAPDAGGLLTDAVLSGADRDGQLTPVNAVFPGRGNNSIVGMWNVTFQAGGKTIDFGYQVWHGDGTEIMNSGGRSPASENFCMGVWQQTGPLSYNLNHFALSYDPGTGALNARVNIKEQVALDPKGNSFSGPFTYDIYDAKGTTLMQHVAGQIAGQRVTVN